MRKLLAALFFLVGITGAFAQVNLNSIPPNTFVGRIASPRNGPASAIPLSELGSHGGGGGGGGSVNSGAANDLGYYAVTGTTISPLAAGTAGLPLLEGSPPTWSAISTGSSAIQFQAGCTGAIVRTLNAKLAESPGISVNDCGADPTGVADSTTAFQNAINALPATGGLVLCPAGTYKISSTLNIGNGTSSAQSTVQGIIFTGGTPADNDIFGAYTGQPGCKITWSGASSTPVFSIKGPLVGWGIQDVSIACNSVTGAIGLQVTSAQFGENNHLYFNNCFKSIVSTSFASTGGLSGKEVDSFHNNYSTVTLNVPDVSGAIGITLTGDSGGSSDTDFNVFTNVTIALGGPTNTTIGILLQVCDSDNFQSVHISSSPGASQAVKFDYSVDAQFPAANFFFGLDPGPTGNGGTRVAWAQSGTPNQTSGPNYVYGLAENNGGLQPKISGINFAPQVVNPGIDITGKTGALGATNLLPYGAIAGATSGAGAGMYQFCYYYEVSTGDAGGSTISFTVNWTDDVGSKSFTNAAAGLTTGSFQQLCFALRIAFNTTPTVSSALSGGVTTLVYAAHFRVLKMD